ncbi:MAG TPA: hypothetical protein VK846_10485 [Candidatus Limnocylindria bacterium]|nr:hypothetical protein [Candidatus Limnocylindria bacterium]
MNFSAENMQRDLQTYAALCDEMLALAAHENQTLREKENFSPGAHDGRRKELLSRLDQSLGSLRTHRTAWQNLPASERSRHADVSRLIGTTQQLAMKVIVLDRENEQGLLRRGLVPARHLATMQHARPTYAAGVYQQHRAASFA